jgi:hypothetical protein
MSIEFSPSNYTLETNKYLFVSNNKLYLDEKTGVLTRIKRAVCTLLQWRNYSLQPIITSLQNRQVKQEVIDGFVVKQAKQCGITPQVLSQIKHFAAHSTTPLTSAEDKERVYTFLKELQGNTKLNASLEKFSNQTTTLPKQVLRDLIAYSHKSGKFAQNTGFTNKVRILYDKFHDLPSVTAKEKLSMGELRTVDSLTKMTTIFDRMERMGISGDFNPLHRELHTTAKLCEVFAGMVKKEATRDLRNETGCSIFCYDFTRSKPLITLSWLQTLIGPILLRFLTLQNNYHLSVAYEGAGEKLQEAHMWNNGGFSSGEMPIISYAFKRLTFKFDSFIKNDDAIKFHHLFGDQYKTELRTRLTAIIRRHQDEGRFADLKNGEVSRFFSFLIPKFNLFAKDWRQGAAFDDKQNVSCIQYAITEPLIALRELEEELAQECIQRNIHHDAPPKFTIPVGKRANLQRMMPHNVVQSAVYVDGITVEEASQVMHSLVDIPDSQFTYFPSLHWLQGWFYDKLLSFW